MEYSFLAIFAKLLETFIITHLQPELEVLTWKLNQSIICGTGRARKTPSGIGECVRQSNGHTALPPRVNPSCTYSKLATQSKLLFVVILQ